MLVRLIRATCLAVACVVIPLVVQGQAARVWISTESDLLGQASDLRVAPDGSLVVLDQLNAYVLVLKQPGRIHLRFGRAGSGPGEFKNPRQVHPVEDGFAVMDGGNNRLQRFDAAGRFVASRPLPPSAGTLPSALSARGQVAVNTLGDSTLMAVYDSSGNLSSRFAKSVAAMPGVISMSAARQETREGKIPAFFRNTVEPYFDPKGDIWLAYLSDGRVERWTAQGRLQASHELDEPETRAIRAAFFAQYKDPAFQGMKLLTYIAHMQATQTGVWVLLNRSDADPAVLLHISPSGARTGRWTLEIKGARKFVVDEARRRIFLVLASTAEVVELPLPTRNGSSPEARQN